MSRATRTTAPPRLARWASVALVMFAAAILGGYWTIRVESYRQLEESALVDMEHRAAALTSAVSEQTRSIFYNLDLALHHLQREFLSKGQLAEEDARAVEAATPPGLLRRITQIDATGVARFSFPAPAKGPVLNLADRPHFSVHASDKDHGLYIGKPIQSRFDGEWLIPVSRRLVDGKGKFAGVVIISVAPEFLAESYGRLAAGREDVVALIHSDGAFLSRSLNLYEHLGKSVRADRPFVGRTAPSSGVFRSISTHEPVDRVFAFRRLKEWPLVVIHGLAVKDTIAPIRANRVRGMQAASAVSALVLLLVAGVCLVLLRLERNLARLGEAEERLTLAFSGASEIAWEWTVPTRQLAFYGDCESVFGQAVREVWMGIDEWFARIHPDDRDRVRTRTVEILKHRADGFAIEFRMLQADGGARWVLARGRTVIRAADGQLERLIGIVMDIDADKHAELLSAQTRESYERLIESAGEGIFVVDANGQVEIINPAAQRLFGSSAAEALGRSATALFGFAESGESSAGDTVLANPVFGTLGDGLARRGVRVNFRRRDGRAVVVELSVSPILIEGRLTGAVVILADIGERLAWEAELERLARTDTLTGVFNRRYFVELSEREFHRAERDQTPLSLLMLDLDHFKNINDSFGHAAGDAVLVAAARACVDELRQVDVFGRLGGEEFGVTLPGVDLGGARLVAERLRVRIEGLDVEVRGQRIRCTASIGVATRLGGEGFDAVLARADDHLYAAKDSGRNRVVADASLIA